MAVDRTGTAWVNFTRRTLFKVSTTDASCAATTYQTDQSEGVRRTEWPSRPTARRRRGDALRRRASRDRFHAGKGLAKIDLTTMKLTTIGEFSGRPRGSRRRAHRHRRRAPLRLLHDAAQRDARADRRAHRRHERRVDARRRDTGDRLGVLVLGRRLLVLHGREPNNSSVTSKRAPTARSRRSCRRRRLPYRRRGRVDLRPYHASARVSTSRRQFKSGADDGRSTSSSRSFPGCSRRASNPDANLGPRRAQESGHGHGHGRRSHPGSRSVKGGAPPVRACSSCPCWPLRGFLHRVARVRVLGEARLRTPRSSPSWAPALRPWARARDAPAGSPSRRGSRAASPTRAGERQSSERRSPELAARTTGRERRRGRRRRADAADRDGRSDREDRGSRDGGLSDRDGLNGLRCRESGGDHRGERHPSLRPRRPRLSRLTARIHSEAENAAEERAAEGDHDAPLEARLVTAAHRAVLHAAHAGGRELAVGGVSAASPSARGSAAGAARRDSYAGRTAAAASA